MQRPLLTLSCRGCQRMLEAAVAPSSITLRAIPAPQKQLHKKPATLRRFHSSGYSCEPIKVEENVADIQADERAKGSTASWFLEVEPPKHPPSQHIAQLPKAPADAPEMLKPMIKYIYEDMGLDDISLFDLRSLDPPVSLGPNLIMLFATARGERHLHVSSGRFVRWLRRNYNVNAGADGLIGAGELKTKLRRLRKKAKILGSSTTVSPDGDHGISTGWVCVHFDLRDSGSGEWSKVDESGRTSGFGSSSTGTTVVIQCMTEPRRLELDLESFWQDVLRENLKGVASIKGDSALELDRVLSDKLQVCSSSSASQWAAMKQASQQHRYFSTSTRQQEVAAHSLSPPPTVEPSTPWTFDAYRQRFLDVQLSGAPMTKESLNSLIIGLIRAPSQNKENGLERLEFVSHALQTAEERGLEVRSRSVFVTLVESIIYSEAYGTELGRAQQNLEHLLMQLRVAPEWQDSVRLMAAYASRELWDKFWDVFREPARYALPRAPQLYILAFNVMSGTKDMRMCRETLRWVYTDMLSEEPPVKIDKLVYATIKGCIDIADPEANALYHNPAATDRIDPVIGRQLKNREFVKVLDEVERIYSDPYNASLPVPAMSAEDVSLFREALLSRPQLPAAKHFVSFDDEQSKDHKFFTTIFGQGSSTRQS